MATPIEIPVDDPTIITEEGRSFTRRWRIVGSSRLSVQSDMIAAGVFIGATYVDYHGVAPDANIKVNRMLIAPEGREIVDGSGYYIVTAEYAPVTLADIPASIGASIELIPDGKAVYWSEQSLTNASADVDKDGNKNLNSAGVPYAEPFKIPWPEETMVFQWVVTRTKMLTAIVHSRSFLGRTNSGEYLGADARELLCLGLDPKPLDRDCYTSEGGLIKYTARMKYKDTTTVEGTEVPGWTDARLSIGRVQVNANYNPLDDESEPLVPIMVGEVDDPERKQVNEAVLLDADGYHLKDPEAAPYVMTYKNIREADFDDIGIEV